MNLLRIGAVCLLVSIGLVAGVIASNPAQAAGLEYQVSVTKTQATLGLAFEYQPQFSAQDSEMGLVLKFERALEGLDLSAARTQLGAWAQSVWSSYDSILIKPSPGVTVEAVLEQRVLNIHFRKAQRSPKVKTQAIATARGATPSVAMARARTMLMLESGQALQARQQLQTLIQHSPNNLDLKLDLARVEQKLHRWRPALKLYNQGLAMRPRSSSIAQARGELLRQYGDKMAAGVQYLAVGDDSNQLVLNLFKGQKLIQDRTLLAMEYDRISADEAGNVQRVDGGQAPFDVNRNRLSFHVATALKHGEQRVSVFSGSQKLGAGWAYAQGTNFGFSELDIEWQRPWFETPESIIGFGHRNRLAFRHSTTYRKNLSFSGDFSLNRYGLQNFYHAAQSYRAQLAGRYQFKAGGESLSLGYSLDAENVAVESTRRNLFSVRYTPLPLLDREEHVIDVGWYKKLQPTLVLDAQLGVAYDRRRRSSAPFTRLLLTARPKANFEWNVSLHSGLATYRDVDERFFRLAAELSWYF